MHRSTAGHNPYNLFILTIVYSKNLPTSYLRTIEHMAMFVVKYIHIQVNSQVMDLSIRTVSVCLKKNNVGKLILYDSDLENGGAKQFGGLLVIFTFVMYIFV